MALRTQRIDVPLAGSIDTQTNPKLVKAGSLLKCENGRQERTGETRPRPGYAAVSVSIEEQGASYSINAVLRMFRHGKRSGFAAFIDNSGDIDHDSVPGTFVERRASDGTHNYSRSTYRPPVWVSVIAELPADRKASDCAVEYLNGWYVLSGNRLACVSAEDGGLAVSPRLSSASNEQSLRTAKTGSTYAAFSKESGDIVQRIFSVPTGSGFNPDDEYSSSAYTFGGSAGAYDVCASGGKFYLAYQNSSGDLIVARIDTAGTVENRLTVTTADDPDGVITIFPVTHTDQSTRLAVYYQELTSGSKKLRAVLLNSDASSEAVSETDIASPSQTISKITGCEDSKHNASAGANCHRIFYEVPASAPTTQNTVSKLRTSALANHATAITLYNERVASKAFEYKDCAHICTQYYGTAQPTVMLRSIYGETATYGGPGNWVVTNTAKLLTNSGDPDKQGLSNVTEIDTGIFAVALLEDKARNTDSTHNGVKLLKIDFTARDAPAARLGGYTLSPGGATDIEGAGAMLGSHLYPTLDSLVGSNGAGSLANNGVYQVKAIFVHYDRFGNVHRSAPSLAATITLGASDDTIDGKVYTNPYVDWGHHDEAVQVEVYRTTDGGSTFYLDTVVDHDLSGASVAFTLTRPDTIGVSALDERPELYTGSGELDPISPPASLAVATNKNRLGLIQADRPNKLWTTKPKADGVAPEFSEFLVDTLPVDGVGLGSLDGRWIVFAKDSILVVAGQGLNALGLGPGYAEPDVVSEDIGLEDPASLARVPAGYIFRSSKGYHLLDRSLQVTYIGAGVAAYESTEIKSASLVDDEHEVRFLTDSAPTCLIYDYRHNAWYTATGLDGQASAVANGVYFRSDGSNLYEETGWDDGGTNVDMTVSTPWVRIGSLVGEARIVWVHLLETVIADHDATVRLYYDYDESSYDEYTISASAGAMGAAAYEAFRFKPEREKCYAVRADVILAGDTYEETSRLTSLSFELADEGGLARLPDSKTMTKVVLP